MSLPPNALRQIGFVDKDPPMVVESKFKIVRIYSLFACKVADAERPLIIEYNKTCKFAIGNDPYQLVQELYGEPLLGKPSDWSQEQQASPPFLVTLTETEQTFKKACRLVKESPECLFTYEEFDEAKKALSTLLQEIESECVLGIVSLISTSERLTTAKLVDSIQIATTSSGKRHRDISVNAFSELTLNESIDIEGLAEKFDRGISPSNGSSHRVSRLLWSAMQEEDVLKSFLFSWTALEVLVNRSFTAPSPNLFPPLDKTDAYFIPIENLFNNPKRGREITTVGHKFAYMAKFVWDFLTVDHLIAFLKCKKSRDTLLHGEEISAETLKDGYQETQRLLGIIVRGSEG